MDIQILLDRIEDEIDARVWVHAEGAWRSRARDKVVTRDLSRLYGLYQEALKGLDLTVGEARLIADAGRNPEFMYTFGGSSLPQQINITSAWRIPPVSEDVDIPALIEKLGDLSKLELLALTDAANRTWRNNVPDTNTRVQQCFCINAEQSRKEYHVIRLVCPCCGRSVRVPTHSRGKSVGSQYARVSVPRHITHRFQVLNGHKAALTMPTLEEKYSGFTGHIFETLLAWAKEHPEARWVID